jgi:HK97 family phage portal protein
MKIPFFSRKAEEVPETKVSKGYSMHMQPGQRATWTKASYEAYSREGYLQNVIVNSAINRVARAISAIEWYVEEGDKRLKAHPLLDLINRPNPMQTRSQWWEQKIGYLMLDGNAFEESVIVRGKPKEIWNLRPDRMTVIPSPTGMPRGYEYKVGGTQKRVFPANPVTGLSDIRHLRLFHPLDDWRGLSPISCAAYGVDQHNESMNWIQSLLQNSARPSGALTIDSDTPLSDDEFHRLKNEIETQYSGSENAGRPMLLEGGLDWKAMGLSPVDMEILRTREMSARDISLAFGVPPLLLNIPGDNTYANYREARLGFYEDTILPLLDYLVQDFNHGISARYFGSARLMPDMDSIEAIAEKRMKMWAMADASDDITLNESRAMKNLPPLPEPLGATLMSEIRSGTRGNSPKPEAAKSLFDNTEELLYGRRSR